MTATLPEIPDEAVMAVAAVYPPHMQRPAERALADAWPHLYATALRHAADGVEDDARFEGVRAQRVIRQSAIKLRRLADEATA